MLNINKDTFMRIIRISIVILILLLPIICKHVYLIPAPNPNEINCSESISEIYYDSIIFLLNIVYVLILNLMVIIYILAVIMAIEDWLKH